MTTIYEQPELYDSIVVGGVRSPGVVTLRGHGRSVAWEVKPGGAQDGASTTRQGREPTEFTATFYLVVDPVIGLDEHAAWEGFAAVLRSTFDGTTPAALDVYHPDLAANGISSCVAKKIGGLEHDGRGGASVTVTFLEYVPPKPKPAAKPRPKGSALKDPNAPGGGTPKPDPLARARAERDRLRREALTP